MWQKIKSLKKQMGKDFWWLLACWIVWIANILFDLVTGKITHTIYLTLDLVGIAATICVTCMEFIILRRKNKNNP